MMSPLKPGQRSAASFRSYIGPVSLLVLATALLVPCGGAWAQAGQLYIYPAKGQSQAQQDKDRYECHSWAVSQTGFDPSNPRTHASNAAPASQYRPSQPHVARGAGRGAALGAVGGAIAGNAGKGAAAGAAMGGLAGGFRRRDERRQQTAATPTENQAATGAREAYNRAFAACLKGRGYTVN
jgi:Glycine-zipper domain